MIQIALHVAARKKEEKKKRKKKKKNLTADITEISRKDYNTQNTSVWRSKEIDYFGHKWQHSNRTEKCYNDTAMTHNTNYNVAMEHTQRYNDFS